MNLASLDGKRIAIELVSASRVDVVLGIAEYLIEEANGPCLRIRIDEFQKHGVFAFVLNEAKWNGEIWCDIEHGCDYGLRLVRDSGYCDPGHTEPAM